MPPRSDELTVKHPALRLIPCRLAMEIMEVLWTDGECSVCEVVRRLQRPIAYTTVMTTLDRLFKKNAARRKMRDRAYIYSPRATREQWRETIAREVGEIAGEPRKRLRVAGVPAENPPGTTAAASEGH